MGGWAGRLAFEWVVLAGMRVGIAGGEHGVQHLAGQLLTSGKPQRMCVTSGLV